MADGREGMSTGQKKPGLSGRVRKPFCCHTLRHPLREEKRGVDLSEDSKEMLHQEGGKTKEPVSSDIDLFAFLM
jgi:hypothetical protein